MRPHMASSGHSEPGSRAEARPRGQSGTLTPQLRWVLGWGRVHFLASFQEKASYIFKVLFEHAMYWGLPCCRLVLEVPAFS